MAPEASPASGAVRKLEVGEVLALLGAPFRDEKVEVTRVPEPHSDGHGLYIAFRYQMT